MTAAIALFVFFVCIVAAAVLYAGGIANEPPPTAAEQRLWPADLHDRTGDDHAR